MIGPIFIAGPTASGKSELALYLARKLGGEIISVDSMQVYRGMDIGTAKPSLEERAEVPHHLVDIAELKESFDVARFVEQARQAESAIRARGKIPIFCGGTGLYFKALAAGIGDAPRSDPGLRQELEAMPAPVLLEELRSADPEGYESIDRSNFRRVVRAVEVIRMTGQKWSSQRADWKSREQLGRWFGLERERSDLVDRINRRVDRMFAAGMVEETRQLLARGLEQNRTAMQSLGYRQVAEHLRGERSLQETIELVKIKTRQFAKRQMTWFRHQLELTWLKVEPADNTEKVGQQILDQPPATI